MGSAAMAAQRAASSPIRFSMMQSAKRTAGFNGQPATARICCSNWLAAQPLDDLRVEPQGLGPVYRRWHGGG